MKELARRPDDDALSAFRDHFTGKITRPGDDDYEGARVVLNAIADRHPAIVVRPTGIGGLGLGGGMGRLHRKHGFTVDNFLSLELVTADGRRVRTSETEHPDLFWGMRGAGPNFGVVTAFELQLHEVGPTILGGMLLHPIERAHEIAGIYR